MPAYASEPADHVKSVSPPTPASGAGVWRSNPEGGVVSTVKLAVAGVGSGGSRQWSGSGIWRPPSTRTASPFGFASRAFWPLPPSPEKPETTFGAPATTLDGHGDPLGVYTRTTLLPSLTTSRPWRSQTIDP